jgi:hypothetical protein
LIRRYTFLSIPGTTETFLFIFPQGRGVAKGGGGKGCGRLWRQSLRGTKINILNKKAFLQHLTNFYIAQQKKKKGNSSSIGEFFEVHDFYQEWPLLISRPWRHKTELRHSHQAIAL